jgi:hypothetical protein
MRAHRELDARAGNGHSGQIASVSQMGAQNVTNQIVEHNPPTKDSPTGCIKGFFSVERQTRLIFKRCPVCGQELPIPAEKRKQIYDAMNLRPEENPVSHPL